MAIDRVTIRSLYAGLYRNVVGFGFLVAAAWLFALFSYYLSRKTGTDWFTRSGSVMGLITGTRSIFHLGPGWLDVGRLLLALVDGSDGDLLLFLESFPPGIKIQLHRVCSLPPFRVAKGGDLT